MWSLCVAFGLLFVTTLAQAEGRDHEDQDFATKSLPRTNMGVLIVKRGARYMGNDLRHHTVLVINRPGAVRFLHERKQSVCAIVKHRALQGNYDSLCKSMEATLVSIDRMVWETEGRVQIADGEISNLLNRPPVRNHHRSYRAPMEFIGRFSKNVFGTALQADIDKVKLGVQTMHNFLRGMANYTAVSKMIHIKFMNATASKIDQLSLEAKRQADFILELHHAVRGQLKNILDKDHQIMDREWLISYIMAYTTSRITKMSLAQQYLAALQEFKQGVERLAEGYLSTDLFPTSEMTKTLELVAGDIKEAGYELSVDDIHFYYTDIFDFYTYTPTHVYIHLNIPVTRKPSHYHLYSLRPFPLPVNSLQSPGYTTITNAPSHMLVNYQMQNFIELTHNDMRGCIEQRYMTCTAALATRPFSDPTCGLALVRDQAREAARLCMHTVTPARYTGAFEEAYLDKGEIPLDRG